MNSNPRQQRSFILLGLAILITTACFCTVTPAVVCMNNFGGDLAKQIECQQYVTSVCGDPISGSSSAFHVSYAEAECNSAAANNLKTYGPEGAACANFKLTSPLDGLANGVNTFYWDPLPGATAYLIEVLESGTVRAELAAGGSETNLTMNLSTNAIGQGSMFLVRIKAYIGVNVSCTREYFILRGAPNSAPLPPPNPSAPNPPAPSCNLNRICEPNLGETRQSCPRDCRG
jgi:hypothetical protein